MSNLTFEQKKMKNYLGKRLNGSAVTIKKHHERGLKISSVIYERFGVHVYQYQQKHLLWFITEFIKGFAKGTRYNYLLTIKKLINLNKQYSLWESVLQKHFNMLESKYLSH